MRAYCDGSGNIDGSAFVVLSGVAAEESVWKGFAREWCAILGDRQPPAPYLHMKEVVAGKGPFLDENGWDDHKRIKLIQDCLMFSQTIDKKKFCTFICSVDMSAYRRIRDAGVALPSVPRICNKFVPMSVFKWYLNNFNRWNLPELHYEFDQNERFVGPFSTLVRRLQKKSRSGLYNHWDIIKEIGPADMRRSLPLQLADMLAWAHHRKLTPHKEGLKWSHLHVMTDAVLPFFRKDVTERELIYIANYVGFGTVVDDYFDEFTFPNPVS
jgi:Protein of unknown function (DUF3800)